MIKYIFGVSLLLASTGANAAIPVPCSTCKTDDDFRTRAMLEEAIGNRGGTYWVYNLADNTVQKWTIKASSGGGGGPVPTSVPSYLRGVAPASNGQTKGTVEASVVGEVQAGHKVFIEGGGSLRPIYSVPVSMLNMAVTNNQTAYDVVWDQNLKGQIESKFANRDFVLSVVKATFLAELTNMLQYTSNYLGLKDQARVVFRLVLSDGSYVDFFWDPLDTTADAQENSARTATGQVIPENIQQLQGKWVGETDNLGAFVEHAARLGASIEYVGEGNWINSISCSPKSCIVERNMR
ncbi:hypothetical protein JR064_11035 [Xanthomonas sp. CFBP 8703]|uniref:Uncharacterized protein n=1 Tax=Xanthomonas bonasiae TaxID=2810351 RepID=A0ABS3B3A7_9XANT|nr:hypothetical protein [Xanthomonas bonasiae]MBN6102701.1 hypothetical protein [Xanthomonas bonasiae]